MHPHTLSGSLPSVHAQTNPMRRCLKTCWTAHGHSGHPLVLCAGEPAQPSLRHTQEASLPNTQEQRSCSGFHLLLVTQSVTHNVPVHCEQARDVARCKWVQRCQDVQAVAASRKNLKRQAVTSGRLARKSLSTQFISLTDQELFTFIYPQKGGAVVTHQVFSHTMEIPCLWTRAEYSCILFKFLQETL
jgi:hypothetical protein